MSRLAVIHQLADALVADLNAQTFSLPCVFQTHDMPELVLERLSAHEGTVAYVVPDGWDEQAETIDRGGNTINQYGLWLVVAQKVIHDDQAGRAAGLDSAELRQLSYFVEQVRGHLKGRRIVFNLDGSTALWRRAGNTGGGQGLWPWMAKHKLHEQGLFLSGAYLVYAV